MIAMELVEPTAKLVCNIMKWSVQMCEFILPKEYYEGRMDNLVALVLVTQNYPQQLTSVPN